MLKQPRLFATSIDLSCFNVDIGSINAILVPELLSNIKIIGKIFLGGHV